jgi:hypothetical protein
MGVRHLLLRCGAIEETLYVATESGVYRHTQGTVDVAPGVDRDSLGFVARPNPCSRSTILTFSLARQAPVRLRILDAAGRQVEPLISSFLPAGTHRVRWSVGQRPAGLYFADLRAGVRAELRKIVVTR